MYLKDTRINNIYYWKVSELLTRAKIILTFELSYTLKVFFLIKIRNEHSNSGPMAYLIHFKKINILQKFLLEMLFANEHVFQSMNIFSVQESRSLLQIFLGW